MSSYYVGFFDTTTEAAEAFKAALVSELSWTPDEDGERVWCDTDGSLGLKITASSSSLAGYCCSEHFTPASACLNAVSQKTDLYLDYAVSKAGSALIVGCHSGGDPAFRGGSVVFAETTADEKNALYMYSNSLYTLNPRSTAATTKTFNTYSGGDYTSLYKMPSFFGGLFKEVYGVFACPSTATNVKCFIEGNLFQLTYPIQGRLAVPIEN